MSDRRPSTSPRPLPERPSLRHLKDQAKDLVKSGVARSIAAAQFQIARLYGFASWPKLKAFVESFGQIGELRQAIDTDDFARVKNLMIRNPALHRAPLGYGKDGPLTWVAECRVSSGPPSRARLDMAKWMIEHGSDVHQGGDGPLMRAALSASRIPMMELLVSYGADVNAQWHGDFPIIFAPCESLDPEALKWLLDRGADPNCHAQGGTALDYAIGTYARPQHDLSACIDVLRAAGGRTRFDVPVVLDLLQGRVDDVAEALSADPSLAGARFPQLEFGASGGRMLTLRGATLLHVAAEYQKLELATLLLDRGADVNARATLDESGVGGQTPIFHSATQFSDEGLPITRLLVERGADLSVQAKVPGHYERPGEIVECTALGYALHLEEVTRKPKTIAFLRHITAEGQRGAAPD